MIEKMIDSLNYTLVDQKKTPEVQPPAYSSIACTPTKFSLLSSLYVCIVNIEIKNNSMETPINLRNVNTKLYFNVFSFIRLPRLFLSQLDEVLF